MAAALALLALLSTTSSPNALPRPAIHSPTTLRLHTHAVSTQLFIGIIPRISSFAGLVHSRVGQYCRARFPPQDWSGQVKAFLSGIGYSSDALQLVRIDGDEVLRCLLRRYDTVWDHWADSPGWSLPGSL